MQNTMACFLETRQPQGKQEQEQKQEQKQKQTACLPACQANTRLAVFVLKRGA